MSGLDIGSFAAGQAVARRNAQSEVNDAMAATRRAREQIRIGNSEMALANARIAELERECEAWLFVAVAPILTKMKTDAGRSLSSETIESVIAQAREPVEKVIAEWQAAAEQQAAALADIEARAAASEAAKPKGFWAALTGRQR